MSRNTQREKRSFYPIGALVVCMQFIFTFFTFVGYSYASGSNSVISLGVVTSSSVKRLLSYEKKEIKVISNKEIFKSTQSEVVINKNEIENAGVGNAAQALQMAPGVSVRSYGAIIHRTGVKFM
jgi:outer membrane receptor for Fe3+-dicitrate